MLNYVQWDLAAVSLSLSYFPKFLQRIDFLGHRMMTLMLMVTFIISYQRMVTFIISVVFMLLWPKTIAFGAVATGRAKA